MPVLNAIETAERGAVGDPPAALENALGAALEACYDAQGNRLDYARFARSAEYGDLVAAAQALSDFDCARLGVGKRLPFWLNVYNALALHAVIARRVTATVREQPDFFSASKYVVAGHEFSLDDIEHGLLRCNAPRFASVHKSLRSGDPRSALAPYLFDERTHFAMHSACRSSPRLRVYEAEALQAALEEAACAYLRQHVRVEEGGEVLRVPKTFQWYASDFGGEEGVRRFVIARLEREEDVEALDRRGGRCALRYLDFDWSLNST